MRFELVLALVLQRVPQLRGHRCAEHVQDLVPRVAELAQALRRRPDLGRIVVDDLGRDDLSPDSAIGGMTNVSRRSRSACGPIMTFSRRAPHTVAAACHGAAATGMLAGIGSDPLAYRQADAPVVPEVEHVADSLVDV
jgi:hypothetical protein